ncbi:MAG: hypothetical protein ACQ9ET_00545 [Nitrosomonadaceae bacterium]
MNNIILQHWSGELDELAELSTANISKYAQQIGVDYRLLRGDVFYPDVPRGGSPIQKMYMLNEEFDKYDMVVMLDMDMFTRKGMTENVFTDTTGIGGHTHVQDRLVKRLKQTLPRLADPKYSYWGGSCWRLPRDVRIELRSHIKQDEIPLFCTRKNHCDEGMMHTLAVRAKITNNYIPNYMWQCGNYMEGIEKCAIIHVRKKVGPKGPKREKIENYRDLVKRGLIEE